MTPLEARMQPAIGEVRGVALVVDTNAMAFGLCDTQGLRRADTGLQTRQKAGRRLHISGRKLHCRRLFRFSQATPCPAGATCNSSTSDHKGVDLSEKGGASVLAPTDMKITVAEQGQGWKSAYGTYVIAKQVEKPGLVFEFHHMVHGSLLVKPGETVAAGTPLGTEGTTGNSTGVHLHFQVASPDAPANAPTLKYVIDPVPILKSKGVL